MPSISNKTSTKGFTKSPFHRGRSKVFYESNFLDDEDPTCLPSPTRKPALSLSSTLRISEIPSMSPDAEDDHQPANEDGDELDLESSHLADSGAVTMADIDALALSFSRNGHYRSSPGRKSQDSGYSEGCDTTSLSGGPGTLKRTPKCQERLEDASTTPELCGDSSFLDSPSSFSRNKWRNSSRSERLKKCKSEILSKRLEREFILSQRDVSDNRDAQPNVRKREFRIKVNSNNNNKPKDIDDSKPLGETLLSGNYTHFDDVTDSCVFMEEKSLMDLFNPKESFRRERSRKGSMVACKSLPGMLEEISDDDTTTFGQPHLVSTPRRRKSATIGNSEMTSPNDECNQPMEYSGNSSLREYLKESVVRCKLTSVNSVCHWLQDVRPLVENECMNTLQSKAFTRTLGTAREATDMIRLVLQRTNLINQIFKELAKLVEFGEESIDQQDVLRLTTAVRAFVSECSVHCNSRWNSTEDVMQIVTDHCFLLIDVIDRSEEETSVDEALSTLRRTFCHLVDVILTQEFQTMVDTIEDPSSQSVLKFAIADLASYGMEGEHLCKLIAQSGGIRALLGVCIEPRLQYARSQALRALSAVCCMSDCIHQLEIAGGMECLTDILCDVTVSARERYEAAGVLAQITSPNIHNTFNLAVLSRSLATLVKVLTELARDTDSSEGFLLATAALANISFLDVQACHYFSRQNTIQVLVQACRHGSKAASIFTKDQVATVLANMAAVPECRHSIVQADGVVILLCFLQARPSPLQSIAETTTCESVQQKSAIALTRLCTERDVARLVLKLQGVQRLVRLCKDEKERNHSDDVLVACLAALRKIATSCSLEELKDLGANELVQPQLLASYLIYSSRQESYV